MVEETIFSLSLVISLALTFGLMANSMSMKVIALPLNILNGRFVFEN